MKLQLLSIIRHDIQTDIWLLYNVLIYHITNSLFYTSIFPQIARKHVGLSFIQYKTYQTNIIFKGDTTLIGNL